MSWSVRWPQCDISHEKSTSALAGRNIKKKRTKGKALNS